MSVLELKNVNKDYKLAGKEKFRALHNINLSFEKGELVSIMGESGSGKSTLMNLIGGLDSQYDGIINIDGKELKNFKEKQLDDYRKKKIGFVFQSFNLIPHLSVLDNVTIGLTLSNVKESVKVQKATELLDKLGLKSQIKKKPTQLSGGQKQRVAIARALINDPDIILADEPTGALDSSTTVQILDILKEIADDGKLVIMVTHSEKVASISSRIVEIADGKIIRDEKNENYQKNDTKNKLINDVHALPARKEKEGHLSTWSAFKLSLHNMWASKVKNILMAVGVSISLVSMILMLSFGSGLTGYISNTAANYTNPNMVTISKADKKNQSFSEDDIDALQQDITQYLKDNGNDFEVNENTMSPGLNIVTFSLDPTSKDNTVEYTPEGGETKYANVVDTYTTPPYYSKKNMLAGEIPVYNAEEAENEDYKGQVMLSKAACDLLEVETPEEAVGKEVHLNASFAGISFEKDVIISGIVDVSFFGDMMVMYVDYGFLNKCVKEAIHNKNLTLPPEQQVPETDLVPNLLYIEADSESTADLIKQYIAQHKDTLTGSVEEQMASMFTEMLSTFSIALAIISGISLFVALIMILVVLYMSVAERTKEIGVLKSIGARGKDIRLIFSSESFLIGLLSGIISIVLSLVVGGIFILVLKSLLGFAPLIMKIEYFGLALLVSIVISVMAGLYPSSKAAKLDPVESLRRE
ncbi:MAG: ATP-binding cassette domain-containing protein [Clostridia bacterium]|nr:ATP-binding cassette domain-containing protein [Clostridia bacterium]